MKILLLQLEFSRWATARPWTYPMNYGIAKALEDAGIEIFTIPIIPDQNFSVKNSWLGRARELCQGKHFDQVWVWLLHYPYDPATLDWIRTLAPIRVGILGESMRYDSLDYAQEPSLQGRPAIIRNQAQCLTHLLVGDENDVPEVAGWGQLEVMWWPGGVPQQDIVNPTFSRSRPCAVFHGNPYGSRLEFLRHPRLQKLLVYPNKQESLNEFQQLFDDIHLEMEKLLRTGQMLSEQDLRQFNVMLRQVRRGEFTRWMEQLQSWTVIVNLPSYAKFYGGRVFEGIASGRPVISWAIPNHPKNTALFHDGEEILLFPQDDSEALANHIERLLADSKYSSRLVSNAQRKLREFHTVEKLVKSALHWVQTGVEPDLEFRSKRERFSLDARDVARSQHMTYTGQTISENSENIKRQETDLKASVPGQDEKRLMPCNGSQEDWVNMSRDQMNQRNQEDQFYTDLFVRSGTWSTPTPNTDESMRWEKIKGFLPDIQRKLSQNGHQSVRILDVGCGRGWLTNLLSDYGYCEGIEPVEPVVEYGRKLFPHLTLYSGFPEDLLTRKNFQPYDLIVTSEVIEHIPHAQKSCFVHTLQQLLKPNGAVILTTPRAEVWDQWKTVSTPNQPIEDWITEQDLLAIFEQLAFKELSRAHIFFDLPSFQYVESPQAKTRHAANNIIPLYQIWAFGFGPIFEERFNQVQSLQNGVGPQGSTLDANGRMSLNAMFSPSVEPEKEEGSFNDKNPLVSVIVPTFNRPSTLKVALESIVQQSLVDYEIIVINDAGEDVEDIVALFNARKNVTYIRHGKNRGLAAARNSGLGVARGKYIAYLDDDDRFLPLHLETLVSYLEENSCQVAYSDAWRVWQIKENAHYVEKKRDVPYSQDFNPENLLVNNCFPVLCMMHEKACLETTGVFDETLTTHEDWDLWIRLSRHFNFAHISKTTAEFTWRMDGSSMTSGIPKDYLRTKKIIYQKYEEIFRLQPSLIPLRDQELRNLERKVDPRTFECSIIIPVFNKADLTKQCLIHLAEVTTGISYEVVLVDNHSTDGTREFLETLGGDVQIIGNATNLGFAKACNQGARAAKGKHLVFLNNDTIPKTGWLDALVYEVDTHSDVAVVGSKLLYPDSTIQHAGVVFSRLLKTPYHIFRGVPENLPAVNSRREFQAVTAACMLVRKETFEKIGGFDEGFVNGFEDVDLCLRIRQMGQKIVYQPKSCLYHLESQTSGRKDHDAENAQRFIERWKHQSVIDEDLVAYQSGYSIQQYVSKGQFHCRLIPWDDVAHPIAWQRVVDLEEQLLGQEYHPLGEMPESQKIQDLLHDVEKWPSDIGILEWVGSLCETLRYEAGAVRFWQKLLTLGDHPNARLGLARATLKNGNLVEAQRHLEVLQRDFSPIAEGYTLQGILFMQKQEFSEARQAFEQSLSIDGLDGKTQIGLGMACMGLGLNDEAWGIFEHVVSVDPDGIEAMRYLIQAGTALQRWEALASHLTRFVERNPADCDMRFALAGVEYRCGRFEKAMDQLTWLRLMTPDFEGLEDLERLLQTLQSQETLVSTP